MRSQGAQKRLDLSKLSTVAVLEREAPVAEPGTQAGGTSPDPEAGSRHCAECGQPLAADQACCLECGAVVRDRRWYRRWMAARWPLRAGLATATGLLLSGFLGLGVSMAVQKGGNEPKPIVTRVTAPTPVTPPAIPPAATVPPKAAPAPAAPAPPAPAHATPAPAASGATATHASPSATTSGGTGSSPSTSGAGSSSGSGYQRPGNPGSPSSGLAFPNGYLPESATAWPSGGSADRATDDDTSTAWTTSSANTGIWLDMGSQQSFSRIGIDPATNEGNYSVTIYGSNGPPSKTLDGWKLISDQNVPVTKKQIPLSDSSGYRYFLIDITQLSGKAGIAETALIP